MIGSDSWADWLLHLLDSCLYTKAPVVISSPSKAYCRNKRFDVFMELKIDL
jgi:hypothetical protein